MSTTGRFAGQFAVVTAAASGIGLAIARILTPRAPRSGPGIFFRPSLDAVAAEFAQRVVMDQADEQSVAAATEPTLREFGAVDMLVVSAGVTGPNLPLAVYPGDEWRRVMHGDVDLPGPGVHGRYSGTSAPLVAGNLVIAGVSGGDEGIRGFVAAYDPVSGRQAWRFRTVPERGEPAYDTWRDDPEPQGGSTWMTGSYDPESG